MSRQNSGPARPHSTRSNDREQVHSGRVTRGPRSPVSDLPLEPLPPPFPATAHRRYASVRPVTSLVLAKRWDDTAKKRHQDKIKSMRPAIDNKPPKRYSHLDHRAKAERAAQERAQQIQVENTSLLNRMARQLKVPKGFSNVDSQMRIKEHIKKPHPSARRKRDEQIHIQDANAWLLERITQRRPHYSRNEWMEERRKNLIYLANHTRYPETYLSEFSKAGVHLKFASPESSRPQSHQSTHTKTSKSVHGKENYTADDVNQQPNKPRAEGCVDGKGLQNSSRPGGRAGNDSPPETNVKEGNEEDNSLKSDVKEFNRPSTASPDSVTQPELVTTGDTFLTQQDTVN
ncbi:hypothetical protein BC832DRAFT_565661 [Gaertneriomyces semiglobifer]|nr:hypothetical protein BC832DRAFT_565661 [Gaertneriomyces semiglobifer]